MHHLSGLHVPLCNVELPQEFVRVNCMHVKYLVLSKDPTDVCCYYKKEYALIGVGLGELWQAPPRKPHWKTTSLCTLGAAEALEVGGTVPWVIQSPWRWETQTQCPRLLTPGSSHFTPLSAPPIHAARDIHSSGLS